MSSTRELLERFTPLALDWAREQEACVLRHGAPLGKRQMADAALVGVQDPGKVRLLVVPRIPMPDDPVLADAAKRAHVITEASRAVTIGHGIIVRADFWQDRELILHQLVHVAQCERAGGLEKFVGMYLEDRATCPEFSVGALEDEARGLAREICQGAKVS